VVAVIVQLPVRALVSGWPPPGWLFVACDVGQGDSLVLPAGGGTAVVIDTGPDPVLVDRCLTDLHVHDIALLLLSHYHLDHVGGIAGVFHGRHVNQVLTGPLAEPASGVEIVRDVLADHGLRAGTVVVGSGADIGGVHLEVLAPAYAMHGSRSDPNNSSVVVRATVHGTRLLLPGDAEVEEQQAVLDSGVDVDADVLKVPHHGSAYSDERFLRAVHAKLAVISVGRHNDYGHPSPLLLAELGRLGLPVRRTDRDGDVAVVCDGERRLSAAVRGTRASTAGLGTATARQPSDRHATMSGWQATRVRPPASTSARHFLRSCWLSATTSSWPLVPSSRSPPLPAGSIQTSTFSNGPDRRSATAS
jgi:competence protein ComEC